MDILKQQDLQVLLETSDEWCLSLCWERSI